VLAHLLQTEMTRGQDAAPTRTSGIETRGSDVVGVRCVCKGSFYKFNPLYIGDQEPDDLSDTSDKILSRS
jgi:hypothetical protein